MDDNLILPNYTCSSQSCTANLYAQFTNNFFSVGQPKQVQPTKIGQPKAFIGRPLSFVN